MLVWQLVKEPLRRGFVVLAAFVAFLAVPVLGFADQVQTDIFAQAKSVTFRTFSIGDDGSGIGCTAFEVEPLQEKYSVVLTAGHCVIDGPAVWMVVGNKVEYIQYRYATDDGGYDSAVGVSTASTSTTLRVRTTPLNPGERLYTVGFGAGEDGYQHYSEHSGIYLGQCVTQCAPALGAGQSVIDSWGTPDQLDFGLVSMDVGGPIRPGASGSAVFDSQGLLVGIVVYSFDPAGHPELAGITTIPHILQVVSGLYPGAAYGTGE